MSSPTKPPQTRTAAPGGISDPAVRKATGKTWAEWIKLLDTAGAQAMPHKAIATLLHEKFEVPGWWSQMLTVGYEQAKGRRVVGQTCAGDFSANGSKTLSVAAAVAHTWFSDPKKRAQWLDDAITLRTATAPKSARLQFPDGSIAGAWITAKGDSKCSVGISHDKLPDAKTAAKHKAFWADALTKLAQLTS